MLFWFSLLNQTIFFSILINSFEFFYCGVVGVNWQHLKYFQVLAQEEHFTRAAELLYISQPALSKAIYNLEEQLGAPLFEKTGRNVKLTRYGKTFYNYVNSATSDIENGITAIRNMVGSKKGQVYLSSIFTMGADFLPNAIKEFKQSYPDIEFYTSQKSTKLVLEDLLIGDIDLGFSGEFDLIDEYSNLVREVVKVEDLVLIVPPGHRFANRKEVAFSELEKEIFIGYNGSSSINRSLEKCLEKTGYENLLNYKYYANEDNSIAGLVRANLGIAFVADLPTICKDDLPHVVVSDVPFTRNIYMVWKKDQYMTPAVKTFRNFVLNFSSYYKPTTFNKT